MICLLHGHCIFRIHLSSGPVTVIVTDCHFSIEKNVKYTFAKIKTFKQTVCRLKCKSVKCRKNLVLIQAIVFVYICVYKFIYIFVGHMIKCEKIHWTRFIKIKLGLRSMHCYTWISHVSAHHCSLRNVFLSYSQTWSSIHQQL